MRNCIYNPAVGGIPIPESVAMTWIIMVVLVLLFIWLVQNLKVIPTTKRQLFVEMAVEKGYCFLEGILRGQERNKVMTES